MEIYKNLRYDSKTEHWGDALEWLIYSAIFNLLPLWATLLLLKGFGGAPIQFSYVTDNGEFLLYTAAYLGGALYLVFRDFNNKRFPSRALLGPFLILISLVSALLFGGIVLIGILGASGVPHLASYINRDFLYITSLIILPASVAVAYIVTVADNIRIAPDVLKIQNQGLEKLKGDFENLRD